MDGRGLGMVDLVRRELEGFCLDFVKEPYLCYTEHGQHALFYARVWEALPESERTIAWNGKQVARIQKEYPTASNLGKSKRQNWDFAALASPPTAAKEPSYDYLRLDTVTEFGLNATKDHFEEDMRRLSHPEANLSHGFAVHLYRLSKPGHAFSGRDASTDSKNILTGDQVAELTAPYPNVTVYFAVADSTGTHASGVWRIKAGRSETVG